MKSLVLVVALAACSRGGDSRSWWCSEFMCVATQDDCTRMVKAIHAGGTCTAHATAFCAHGCEKRGDQTLCSPTCSIDRETCATDVARAGTCREEPPPAHPELFPYYVEPGWWCGDIGAISSCEKAKDACEKTVNGPCTRASQQPYCWGRRLTGAAAASTAAGGKVAYVCTKTMESCDQTLQFARAKGSGDFEIASVCAAWPYD